MKKRLLPVGILLVYSVILIKVMVLKDVPAVKVGTITLNFGGTQTNGQANLIPFTTILPYLLGEKGYIIGGLNLLGNIVLLVPLGFLVALIFPNLTRRKSLLLATATGLIIEGTQVLFRVGIFDIDDVLLNALGVMIGYAVFRILTRWIHSKEYKKMAITAAFIFLVALTGFYGVIADLKSQPQVNPEIRARMNQSERTKNEEGAVPQTGDLCGGTGGNGQIISLEKNSFTMKYKEGRKQIINLTDQSTIKTSGGDISLSEVKIGYKVTLVGGTNADGSFTADNVFVCNEAGPTVQTKQ